MTFPVVVNPSLRNKFLRSRAKRMRCLDTLRLAERAILIPTSLDLLEYSELVMLSDNSPSHEFARRFFQIGILLPSSLDISSFSFGYCSWAMGSWCSNLVSRDF